MDLIPTVLGALPDLGSLGGAVVLLLVTLRWFAQERTAWQTERAALLAEAAAARAEARQDRAAARSAQLPPSL